MFIQLYRVFASYKERGTYQASSDKWGGAWLSAEIAYHLGRDTVKAFLRKAHRQTELLRKVNDLIKHAKRKEAGAMAGKQTMRPKYEIMDPSSPPVSDDEAGRDMDVD